MKGATLSLVALLSICAFGSDVVVNNGQKTPIGRAQFYWLLNKACYHGDEIGARMLLDAGADPNGWKDYEEFKKTEWGYHEPSAPINLAARVGRLEIVRLLLAQGARPDNPEGENHTALTLAASAGHEAVVTCLLEAGADYNHREVGGTALQLATKQKRTDTAVAIQRFINKQPRKQ